MLTVEEANKLASSEQQIFVVDPPYLYTTCWYSKSYLITRDKHDGHLAMLMRRTDKAILYACEHTIEGAKLIKMKVE